MTLMAIDMAGYDPVAAAASGDASGWFNEQILTRRVAAGSTDKPLNRPDG